MVITNKDLIKILDKVCGALNKINTNYLIVGGTAVNFHGYPRISGGLPPGVEFDIDIWYEPTLTNFHNKSICEGL